MSTTTGGTTNRTVDVVMVGTVSTKRRHRRRRRRQNRNTNNSNDDNNSQPIPKLLPELWTRVLSFLDPPNLLRAQSVCRSWRDAISGEANGYLWRDVVKHDMARPKSIRLAYPKAAFKKLEQDDGNADYRDYALVSYMRTCPDCHKVLDLCRCCELGECRHCGYKDTSAMVNVGSLSDRFELPRWLCEICDPRFEDPFLMDYYLGLFDEYVYGDDMFFDDELEEDYEEELLEMGYLDLEDYEV